MKKRDRIKTIFFDAADTLFYIRRGLGHTYAEVARKYGADPDPSDIKKAFSRAFKSAPPLAFGNVSEEERPVVPKAGQPDVDIREGFVSGLNSDVFSILKPTFPAIHFYSFLDHLLHLL